MILLILLIISTIAAFQQQQDKLYKLDITNYTTETIPDIPYYIIDQITALHDQIETNKAILYNLDTQIYITYDHDKKLQLEKKRNDILYRIASKEEKLEKLLTKYNIDLEDYI